jgi:hypothetical protein
LVPIDAGGGLIFAVAVAFCCCKLLSVAAVCAKDELVVVIEDRENATMAMTNNAMVK